MLISGCCTGISGLPEWYSKFCCMVEMESSEDTALDEVFDAQLVGLRVDETPKVVDVTGWDVSAAPVPET